MELKRLNLFCCGIIARLLIVPYGIETDALALFKVFRLPLLIVPYGIETQY